MKTGQCNGTIIKSSNELVCEPNTGEQLEEYVPTPIPPKCEIRYTIEGTKPKYMWQTKMLTLGVILGFHN